MPQWLATEGLIFASFNHHNPALETSSLPGRFQTMQTGVSFTVSERASASACDLTSPQHLI
jgi:hypothetical protein